MRRTVRAIIIEKELVLAVKRVKNNETYWVFPGGGVEENENDKYALDRECKEELGVNVEVGDLFFQCEYDNPQFGKQDEYFYISKIIDGELGTGDGPEFQENAKYEGTREIEWLKIKNIERYNIRPSKIKSKLNKKI